MNVNKKPLVSVIIPSYNHEKYVEQAILSVINQTYKNIELIIIDDGSKDNSPYLIKELINRNNSFKIIFEIQDNMGLCKTLNKSIRMAKGEFVAILASDDMYLPNRIEECVNLLLNAKSNICAVYSDGFIINGNGMKIGRFSDKYTIPIGKNIYKELLIGNWIAALSVLYRRSSLFECGLFDENIEVEDYDMLLKLAQKFKFEYIPKPLFLYRLHGLNYSSNKTKMDEQFKVISKKYKDLQSYRNYTLALKNKNFIELLHELNFLNIELTFRAIIRKIQAIFGIVNVSYFEMMKLVFRRLYIQLKGLIRSHFLRLCGLKIGKNTRIFGKTIIKGNRKNIIIGNQVSILGNIQLITEYSRSRELIQIGDNTIIDNDTILFSHGGQINIGSDCFIGSSVRIQAKGGVYIGNDTMIAANTSIFASNHITDRNDVPYKKQGEKFIGISIGQNCWIGSNVVILDGADIGDSCIIGANCIIKGQYPSNSKIVAKEIIGKPYNESEKRE